MFHMKKKLVSSFNLPLCQIFNIWNINTLISGTFERTTSKRKIGHIQPKHKTDFVSG